MASTDAQPWPIKNKALRLTFPVFTAAGQLVTTGTQAVTISKDAGTFANPAAGATNATQIATTSGVWYVDLGAGDTNCDTLAVKISDGTNPPTILVIYPVEIKEPSAVPGWGNGATGIEEAIAWLQALARNKVTQSATTQTLRNDADSADIATAAVSESAGVVTRAEFT